MSIPIAECIGNMEGVAWKFLRTAHAFDHVSTHPDDGQFWILVQNSLGEIACLLWCHLFGNAKQERLHFNHFAKRAEICALGPSFAQTAIEKRLMDRAGLDENGYAALQKTIRTCRNKYIAHRDVDGTQIFFPDLDQCVLIAEEMRTVLSESVDALIPQHLDVAYLADYFREHTNLRIRQSSQRDFMSGLRTADTWLGQLLANR